MRSLKLQSKVLAAMAASCDAFLKRPWWWPVDGAQLNISLVYGAGTKETTPGLHSRSTGLPISSVNAAVFFICCVSGSASTTCIRDRAAAAAVQALLSNCQVQVAVQSASKMTNTVYSDPESSEMGSLRTMWPLKVAQLRNWPLEEASTGGRKNFFKRPR